MSDVTYKTIPFEGKDFVVYFNPNGSVHEVTRFQTSKRWIGRRLISVWHPSKGDPATRIAKIIETARAA